MLGLIIRGMDDLRYSIQLRIPRTDIDESRSEQRRWKKKKKRFESNFQTEQIQIGFIYQFRKCFSGFWQEGWFSVLRINSLYWTMRQSKKGITQRSSESWIPENGWTLLVGTIDVWPPSTRLAMTLDSLFFLEEFLAPWRVEVHTLSSSQHHVHKKKKKPKFWRRNDCCTKNGIDSLFIYLSPHRINTPDYRNVA